MDPRDECELRKRVELPKLLAAKLLAAKLKANKQQRAESCWGRCDSKLQALGRKPQAW